LTASTVNTLAGSETDYLSRFHRLVGSSGVYRTSAHENCTHLPGVLLANGTFSAELPNHSVTTFLLNEAE
jgi:hypothetical protein